MIDVRYANGMHYTCHEFSKIDFSAFVLEKILALRVDPFTWNKEAHGDLVSHTLRRASQGEGKIDWQVYVLETTKKKIFVFENGDMAMLTEWIPGNVIFKPPSGEDRPEKENNAAKKK